MKTVKDVDLEKEVKRHPETLGIIEIHGKSVYWARLPDWHLCYVECETKEEIKDLRLILFKLEDEEEEGRIIKVTDKRIYFEL